MYRMLWFVVFWKGQFVTGRIWQNFTVSSLYFSFLKLKEYQRKDCVDTTLILSRGNIVGRGLWRHTVAPASARNHFIIILRQPFSPVGEESGGDEQTRQQLRVLWTALFTLTRRYLLGLDAFPSGNYRRPPHVFRRSTEIKVSNQKRVILVIAANVSVAIVVG